MSARLFLVRHGRTTLNAEGRFRGRLDPPLDDVGYLDAARAAQGLKDSGLVAVYTSPLRRATQTAEFVASAANVRRFVDPALIDLDHGSWEGLTPEEAALRDPEEFRRFREDPEAATPPSGESLAEVRRRMIEALCRLSAAHSGAPVAAVSHEIPIRLVVSHPTALPASMTMWDLRLPTGAVIELAVNGSSLGLDHAGDVLNTRASEALGDEASSGSHIDE